MAECSEFGSECTKWHSSSVMRGLRNRFLDIRTNICRKVTFIRFCNHGWAMDCCWARTRNGGHVEKSWRQLFISRSWRILWKSSTGRVISWSADWWRWQMMARQWMSTNMCRFWLWIIYVVRWILLFGLDVILYFLFDRSGNGNKNQRPTRYHFGIRSGGAWVCIPFIVLFAHACK